MLRFAVLGAVNWTHRWFTPDGPMSGAEIGRAFGTSSCTRSPPSDRTDIGLYKKGDRLVVTRWSNDGILAQSSDKE